MTDNDRHFDVAGDRITFEPWYGEFGWEVAVWAPYCRRHAAGYDEIVVTSFAGCQALYADFATRYVAHDVASRSLDYPKSFGMYYHAGRYRRYGVADRRFDVLIHARGINRKQSINPSTVDLAVMLAQLDVPIGRVASIGTTADGLVPATVDYRGVSLTELTDAMAGAKVTIGASSGPLHLAAHCGSPLVVWGDTKTRYRQSLKTRYQKTWNPFGVPVEWISADDWRPPAATIAERARRFV